ncbi:metallophosphoesterase [Streptomyces sp. TLI_171]|uniref:metallophosphoesterase family protein n=1 Tax=Streptomyces sp. TLI_171 TaxID=1938859 RepID=UPI000C3B1983|nr:metallophosphoesterase [Streptomyces sp. TLI_171]RKE17103.1 Icc-related predicted phosphoesterase [Streptomyces sp. TLI_171]
MSRVLVVGDVHGEFALLARLAAAVRAAHGPLDAILAVGDVEANRDEADAAGVYGPAKYRKLGDFPLLTDARVDLGAPLFFIGGNHEPWPALDAAGPGEWAPGVHFLGRCGLAEVAGLRVAFLSGIHSSRVTDRPRPVRESLRDRNYYTAAELQRLTTEGSRSRGGVDVLLTHDWPAGLPGADVPGERPVGRPELRTLTERLRPRHHLCGHMHRPLDARIGPTAVTCLSLLRDTRNTLALLERAPDGSLLLTRPDP